MTEFIAYIDEAGDEGFGKLKVPGKSGGQSCWLVIGACLVEAQHDAKLPGWRDQILAKLPHNHRDLHFQNYRHAERVFISQQIAALPVRAAMTFSHKITIPGSRWEATFKKPGFLYNWLVRWLLERLTSECNAAAGPGPHRLRLVFSRRGGTNYQVMKDYLILMRDGREQVQPIRNIVWRVMDLNDIAVEAHSKWAGLQIADCMTSAFFAAVEPNPYGNYERAYADILRDSVIRKAGNALNHGIAPVPAFNNCAADARQEDFFRSFVK